MITIKEFIPMIERKLSISCSKLMVGKRRVNFIDDADRSVHFFLLLNSPWYAHAAAKTPAETMQLLVSLPSGKVISVQISPHASVETLSATIEQKTGIPANEFWLHCGSKPMRDGL